MAYIFQGLLLISNGTFLDHETTPEYSLLLTAQDNPQALSSEVRQRSSVPVGFYINCFTKHYNNYISTTLKSPFLMNMHTAVIYLFSICS